MKEQENDKKKEQQNDRRKEQQDGSLNKRIQNEQSAREKMGPKRGLKGTRTSAEGKGLNDDAYDPDKKDIGAQRAWKSIESLKQNSQNFLEFSEWIK